VLAGVGLTLILVETGKPLGVPVVHRGPALAVAYCPDGKTIATGTDIAGAGKMGDEVRLLDAATGQDRLPPLENGGQVAALAFSPDGKSLLAGGRPGGDAHRRRPTLGRSDGKAAEPGAAPPGGDGVRAAAFVDAAIVRAFGGGDPTGPSPLDRGKKGTKHTLSVDRHGVPLAIRTAPANASDHRQIIPLVPDFPRVKGKPRRPKELPDKLYADRGYDCDATRWLLAWLGIAPHIARRKTPHASGLRKVRWVVERTISWLQGPAAARIRYDRLAVMQDAWNTLAACVICFRVLHDDTVPE
jgi:transposase